MSVPISITTFPMLPSTHRSSATLPLSSSHHSSPSAWTHCTASVTKRPKPSAGVALPGSISRVKTLRVELPPGGLAARLAPVSLHFHRQALVLGISNLGVRMPGLEWQSVLTKGAHTGPAICNRAGQKAEGPTRLPE